MATQESREGSGCVHPQELRELACSLFFKSSDLSRSENRDLCFFPPANHVLDMAMGFPTRCYQWLLRRAGFLRGESASSGWLPLRKPLALFSSAQDCPIVRYMNMLGLSRVPLMTKVGQNNFLF